MLFPTERRKLAYLFLCANFAAIYWFNGAHKGGDQVNAEEAEAGIVNAEDFEQPRADKAADDARQHGSDPAQR